MTSFSLKNVKRKLQVNPLFAKSLDEEIDLEEEEAQYKKKKEATQSILLEDNVTKSNRLKMEGITLAEAERFREAIARYITTYSGVVGCSTNKIPQDGTWQLNWHLLLNSTK